MSMQFAIPSMLSLVALTCPALAVASAQTPIPIRTTAPAAQSPEQFGSSLGIRALPNGKAMVHDPAHKRMIVFDSSMQSFTVSADTVGTSGTKYPSAYGGAQLTPYLGDSTLYRDLESKALIVIDPGGKFIRAIAHPKAADLNVVFMQNTGVEGVDPSGRLIYRSSTLRTEAKLPLGATPPIRTRDTVSIVRADFNSRMVDTVASFTMPHNNEFQSKVDADGKKTATRTVNALPQGPDDWGVMSDGTIAVIRSHDYHVDFTFPDGKTLSSDKLPYAWRRLSDEDKQRRADSTKHVVDSLVSIKRFGSTMFSTSNIPGKIDTIIPTIVFAPIADMADYVPPFRAGALKPDADNNIWVLPTTSSSARGGLLYDVINNKGELFERVQLPADRFVVGFGKGGVVYLAVYDRAGKFYTLERTRVVRTPQP